MLRARFYDDRQCFGMNGAVLGGGQEEEDRSRASYGGKLFDIFLLRSCRRLARSSSPDTSAARTCDKEKIAVSDIPPAVGRRRRRNSDVARLEKIGTFGRTVKFLTTNKEGEGLRPLGAMSRIFPSSFFADDFHSHFL